MGISLFIGNWHVIVRWLQAYRPSTADRRPQGGEPAADCGYLFRCVSSVLKYKIVFVIALDIDTSYIL